MTDLEVLIEDLVAANRILAAEGVVDAFGHISARHPHNPERYLLSRARAPERIEADDIMEFTLDGEPVDARGRKPYLERFIHGAIYEAQPEIRAVVHSHSYSVIPFGITGQKLRPLMHSCGSIGHDIPVWEPRKNFGDTDMLVSSMAMGRDLAQSVVGKTTCLMRGHGSVVTARSVREAVYTAVYLEVNANIQTKASQFGEINFLSQGEVDLVKSRLGDGKPAVGVDRAWEYWCSHAGVDFKRRS